MQRIFPTSLTPEEYAEQGYHKQVPPPENCPNCERAHALEALAYYHRYVTAATALVLLIWVRRFLCRHCRASVSCLPEFAQPYRPVNTPTIAAGFNGRRMTTETTLISDMLTSLGDRPFLVATIHAPRRSMGSSWTSISLDAQGQTDCKRFQFSLKTGGEASLGYQFRRPRTVL